MIRLLRYILPLLLLTFSFGKLHAQTYGNEWINYGQKYYAFKVYPNSVPTYFGDLSNVETGIYILDYATLAASGIPIGTFTPANIQIFGREKEVPLHIVDGGDNSFDPGDYILFYTERNDGWLDNQLFDTPQENGNPFYSLYNDTIQYFFTWNSSTNNLRYTIEQSSDFSSYTPADYILIDRWQSNTVEFRDGEQYLAASSSFFTNGEGWSSGAVNGAGTGYTWNAASVQFPGIYQGPGAPDVFFKGMQAGASDNASAAIDHHVRWTIGASNYPFVDALWAGYRGNYMEATIPNSEFPASGNSNLMISIIGDQPLLTTDYQSISY